MSLSESNFSQHAYAYSNIDLLFLIINDLQYLLLWYSYFLLLQLLLLLLLLLAFTG
jgi:hypothetical protein